MLSNKTLSALTMLGINLKFRDEFDFTPKMIPITILTKEPAADLLFALQNLNLGECKEAFRKKERQAVIDRLLEIGDYRLEMVFLSRNYDYTTNYFIVTDMSYVQLNQFNAFIQEQKGGIL